MAMKPQTGIEIRATSSEAFGDGLRFTIGTTLLASTLAQASRALSAELMIAASIAPTKTATAIGCRCSIASVGTTASESASPAS